nr:AMP-dependent synthetase/ligase [Tanacetum cinerariifolium]
MAYLRIIVGFYSINGLKSGKVEVHDNVIVGRQSILLLGFVVEIDVILGVLSVAPIDSVIKRGLQAVKKVLPRVISVLRTSLIAALNKKPEPSQNYERYIK